MSLTTVVSVITAVAAVAAAVASVWSAKAASAAAARTSREARAALLRDLSQSVTAVISRGERVGDLVRRLKVARETQFALAGRNVTAAGPLIRADEEKRARADLMVEAARAHEMRSSFEKCTDEELHAFARNMASYAISLEITEADLAGQLERVEAGNRDQRSRNP
jgi:hypothetical protein